MKNIQFILKLDYFVHLEDDMSFHNVLPSINIGKLSYSSDNALDSHIRKINTYDDLVYNILKDGQYAK